MASKKNNQGEWQSKKSASTIAKTNKRKSDQLNSMQPGTQNLQLQNTTAHRAGCQTSSSARDLSWITSECKLGKHNFHYGTKC
eukprot:323474-Ditylum_brightwellii.AAC.1